MKICSKVILFIILKIIIFIIDETYTQEQHKQILLILLFDGFRNDYFDRGITPNLNCFRKNGVYSDYLRTIYPALAVPSLHSIATGLYPQNHGIKFRNYSSPNGAKTISISDPTMFTQNETSPIWAINEKNGGKSACMMWPGTESSYKDGSCSYLQKYDKAMNLRDRADKVITWLNNTDKPNLVMFYIEDLDRITHFFGHLSRNSSMMIKKLDLLTKYLISKLVQIKVYHRTNIFILSDHGMHTARQTGVIKKKFRTYVPENNAFSIKDYTDDVNGITQVVIKESYIVNYTFSTEEFWKLARDKDHFTVVKIPPNINGSVGHIEYAACPNYVLQLERWKLARYNSLFKSIYEKYHLKPPPSEDERPFGVHGYLRENDAVFMAKGPQLVMFKKIPPIEMVDFYSAFTRLLNIQGDFERDGNYSRILGIFRPIQSINWTVLITYIFALACITSMVFYGIVYYLLKTRFILVVNISSDLSNETYIEQSDGDRETLVRESQFEEKYMEKIPVQEKRVREKPEELVKIWPLKEPEQ